MDFNQLSWGAFCFYYRSSGDSKYCQILGNHKFINKFRNDPAQLDINELERLIILDHIKIEHYDLLLENHLAEEIRSALVELKPVTDELKGLSLLDCDLTDNDITTKINKVYVKLFSIQGLWLTGVSKIAHLINDQLFILINSDIASHFRLLGEERSLQEWLVIVQNNARTVYDDFNRLDLEGTPQDFLSQKLGYIKQGCQKSIIKYIDEYFWLTLGDNLPIPPAWTPDTKALPHKLERESLDLV